MNPEQRKRLKSILAKQASGEKLTPDEEQALTSARANFADEFSSVGKEVSEEFQEKSPGQTAQEREGGKDSDSPTSEAKESEPEKSKTSEEDYQLGETKFRLRTPQEVAARDAQGRALLNRGLRARMNAAQVTGQQVNDLRSSREAELLDQGVSSGRAKIVAQMEAQNMLRASRGLPTYTTADIVGDEKQGYSLSPSARDQRIFNESRGLTEYGAEVRAPMKNAGETEVLGRSIMQPDGNIAFSTTAAGRKFMGTEGRDRFAGIGRGFGGPDENPMDRAIVENNSTNGVINRGAIEQVGRGTPMAAAGQFANQSLDMLGNQRRAEFSAAMNQRSTDPSQDVGVDASGKPRTAQDLIKRSQGLGGVLQRRAGMPKIYNSENVFGR